MGVTQPANQPGYYREHLSHYGVERLRIFLNRLNHDIVIRIIPSEDWRWTTTGPYCLVPSITVYLSFQLNKAPAGRNVIVEYQHPRDPLKPENGDMCIDNFEPL